MRLGKSISKIHMLLHSLCLLFFVYCAEEDFTFYPTEGEPSILIDRCVNPISGDYIISETDLIIPGYEPISLDRTYISGAQKGKQAYWSIFPHLYMHFTVPENKKKNSIILTVAEPSGATLQYKNLADPEKKDRYQFFPVLGKSTKGLTNTSRGEIGARTNISHNRIVLDKSEDAYVLTTCDGTKRYYLKPSHTSFAFLKKERKPNGNWVIYEYNDDYYTLKEIRTTNPSKTKTYAKVTFEYENPNPYNCKNFTAITESQERLHYYFHLDDVKHGKEHDHFFRLNCIVRPYLPKENLSYVKLYDKQSTFLIKERSLDNHPISKMDYYGLEHNSIDGNTVHITKARDARLRRLKTLHQPVGPDGSDVCTHHFIYKLGNYAYDKKFEPTDHLECLGVTQCFDAYNKKTEYVFDTFFIPMYSYKYGINLHHPKTGQESLLFGEGFNWYFDGHLNRLRSHYTRDQEKILSIRYFDYDDKGNVVQETLQGNLSGHNYKSLQLFKRNVGESYIVKNTYSKDAYALPTSKTLPSGLSYQYEYLPDTNLIKAQYTLFDGVIKIREFNIYNEDHVIIQSLVDDGQNVDMHNLTGVTQRTLVCISPKKQAPAMNFPEVIEEKYLDLRANTYQLLKKRVLHYSEHCNVSQEDVYDAQGSLLYSTYHHYDYKRRLVRSTDSLGRTSSFTYNDFNHLIKETLNQSALKILHTKDILGRELITTTVDTQGVHKETRISYDLKSRVSHTTDPNGNSFYFSYDDLDHEIESILPSRTDADHKLKTPIIKKINDPYGNPLSITDPLGNTTSFTYNSLSKPVSILYPDNTKEIFYYNSDGTLKEHFSVTGLKTECSYDYLGRILLKKVSSKTGSPLYEESFTYNAFNLLSYTDRKGVKTLYRYDGAGRKIETSTSKGELCISKEEYVYDASGRHDKTILHGDSSQRQVHIKVFDQANRVIEERQEDEEGTLFSKVQYEYDSYDNRTAIITSINHTTSTETFTYDDYKRVTSHTNPEGHVSYTEYIDHIPNPETHAYDSEKIYTDPKGRQVKERYNSVGQLVSITLCNALGSIQGEELFSYDLNGNKIKQLSRVFAQHSLIKEVSTLWEYDCRNRVITLIEAFGDPLQKVTRFTYTADGKEASIIQPNGITLYYSYDDLGQMISLSSSDHSVHYTFTYNQAGELIQETNALTEATTLRSYHAAGHLLTETLANGLSLAKTYDSLGRTTSMTLHDHTKITYDFDAFHLKNISKYSPDGALHYTHHYRSYNLQHQPTEETAIFDLCSIQKSYDLCGRNKGIFTPYYSEQMTEFDSVGNLLQLRVESDLANHTNTYSYDDLDHLIEEKGSFNHNYSFDSHHNRLSKDTASYSINALNELLHDDRASYAYTPNGNRSLKTLHDKTLFYEYDALNRLTSLKNDSIIISFTYDSWHRRLSKSIKKKSFFGNWDLVSEEYYLYDGEKEIGSTDSNYAMQQLRVLGLGKGGDIGAAVAIEINNTPYVPFHDLLGNIVNLVHAQERYIAESYRYNAFGDCHIYSYYYFSLQDSYIHNPWRYQSKRIDDESGLVFFGRRFFDPKAGTWLSPDPLGVTQNPNLYHFLLGNPFSLMDIYGLSLTNREEDPLAYIRPTTGSDLSNFPFSTNVVPPPYQNNPWLTPQDRFDPRISTPPTHIPYRLSDAPPQRVQTTPYPIHPDYAFILMNGINTNRLDAYAMAHSCAQNLNYHVDLVYNPTQGLPRDAKKVCDTYRHGSPPFSEAQVLSQQIRTNIDSCKETFLFLHSGAANQFWTIADTLSQQHRDKLHIAAFGGSKRVPNNFGKTVVNYISMIDLLSHTSRFFNFTVNLPFYLNPQTNPKTEVVWLKPHHLDLRKEHAFMGDTYQKALQRECSNIKKRYGF